MGTSPDSLEHWLDVLARSLTETAERLHSHVPAWERVVVAVDVNRQLMHRWAPLEQAQQLWHEAITSAAGGSVTLRAEDVRDGALHVVIQYSARGEQARANSHLRVITCWKAALMVEDPVWWGAWRERDERRFTQPVVGREFWHLVELSFGKSGALVLILWDQYRSVAESLGATAMEAGERLFLQLCERSLGGAEFRSRLSGGLFAAYWTEHEPDAEFTSQLRKELSFWFPAEVHGPFGARVNGEPVSEKRVIPVSVQVAFAPHAAGEPASAVYERAQAELRSLVDALPKAQQRPALPESWQEQLAHPLGLTGWVG